MSVMNAEKIERNQRDVTVSGESGNGGKPIIKRKRFAGCSELSCFQDAPRSDSVKGNAS